MNSECELTCFQQNIQENSIHAVFLLNIMQLTWSVFCEKSLCAAYGTICAAPLIHFYIFLQCAMKQVSGLQASADCMASGLKLQV